MWSALVWGAMAAGVLGGGLGIVLALTKERRIWVVGMVAVIVLALGMALFAPAPSRGDATEKPVLFDVSKTANIKTRYLESPDKFGELLAPIATKDGMVIAMFSYCIMEVHEEIKDPVWQVQCNNAGLELAQRRHIPLVENPAVPMAFVSYLAAEAARGVNIAYFNGPAVSNVVYDEGRGCIYYHKAILCVPATALSRESDPGAVQREPVGAILWFWCPECSDPQYPDPWTPARKWLLLAETMTLLGCSVPLLRRARRRQYE